MTVSSTSTTGVKPGYTLGILGCGNLGTSILKALLSGSNDSPTGDNTEAPLPSKFVACCKSEASRNRLRKTFSQYESQVSVVLDLVEAVQKSDVVILGCDPSQVRSLLDTPKVSSALNDKLLISICGGWTVAQIEKTIKDADSESKTWVVRALPNVAAAVAESMTAIEEPGKDFPQAYAKAVKAIFDQTGKAIFLEPHLIDGFTSLAGSTPAYLSVVVDALIEGGLAVGFPRPVAQLIAYQSFLGSAKLIQDMNSPADLRAVGTSPAGCTIKAMVELEKTGIRGHLAQAVVTSAEAAGGLGNKK